MLDDYRLGLEPIGTEHDRVDADVQGELPHWLAGTFLRNGPGRFSVGDRDLAHWFDGFGMLRAYRIDGGSDRVTFSNRFLRSEAYRHAEEHGELGYREFASDPPTSRRDRLKRLLDPGFTDNGTVDVDHLGGEFVATTESPRSVAFDLDTLRTRRTVAYPGDLGATDTVHPHFEFDTGAHLGFAADFGRDPGYVYYRVPAGTLDREPIGRVPMDPPGYVHSFGLTERYAVFTVPPFVVDSPFAFLRDRSVVESFEWCPELGTRIVVLDRETGRECARYRTEPFFVFHGANAFERGGSGGGNGTGGGGRDRSDAGSGRTGELVLDLVTFPDAGVVEDFYLDNLRSAAPSLPTGELRRLRLPFDPERGERRNGAVVTETRHRGPMAFPMIHYERHNGRPYRYVWGIGNRRRPPAELPNRIVKIDLRTDGVRLWEEPKTYPSEAVFVPSPDPDAEDDGVLLSSALDAGAERTFLLVLDAATLTEVARATLPTAMPLGFHGQFYREGERSGRSMP
jgi:carotenoid cleavage dioxygenase-like enzyme